MPNRMIRFTTSRSGFNPHGLRFAEGGADPSDKSGDTPPSEDPPAEDPPADDPEPGSEPTAEERLAAAEKINKDLERKLKRSDDNRKRVSELEEQLAKLQGKEAEFAEQQKQREVERAALDKANDRIRKAELRAAAAGKVAPDMVSTLPQIADLSSIEVGEDGEVDTDAMASLVADLIEKYPSLSTQGEKRFTGSGDGGHRKETPKRAASLSEAVANRLSSK